jgi:hypothetical protein
MPSAEDSDASAHTGRRARGHGRDDDRASAARRPIVLNRSELANMNRLIANKMRGDIESALEISDENSLRNLDAAAAR